MEAHTVNPDQAVPEWPEMGSLIPVHKVCT